MLICVVSGFVGVVCLILGMLYMLQVLFCCFIGNLLVVGVGFLQLVVLIVWIVLLGLVDIGQWYQLYLFEVGLVLCVFVVVVVLKLLFGIQVKVFELLDFFIFVLLVLVVVLLVIVLVQGYICWWFNMLWLGWVLIVLIVLFIIVFIIEYYWCNLLLQICWLLMLLVLYFIVGVFLICFLIIEQFYGVVNLMCMLGMGLDQMCLLFVVILVGVIVGIVGVLLIFGLKCLIVQLLMVILLLGVVVFFDQYCISLDWLYDFYVSQFLVLVGVGMFMGFLIMFGIFVVLKQGVDYMIIFLVMLLIMQILGGLVGLVVLGIFQLYCEQLYFSVLISQFDLVDLVVV